MFCYACIFDLVVLDLVFICKVLLCIFLCFFGVSADHFGYVFSNIVLLGLVLSSTEPTDWLERTSLK